MALKVIGSGHGRTGTTSLKLALEQLGFTRCYHMIEVPPNPSHAQLWVDAADGRPDWDRLFEGYAASVDYPGARFWRELTAFYPDAKVVHTTRDPESWFKSAQATVFSAANQRSWHRTPELAAFFERAVQGEFGDRIGDRAFMIAHFKRHNEAVLATIPEDRLLVHDVSEGWDPLCRFLGVAVPDAPFPHENSREQFKSRLGATPTNPDELRTRIQTEFERRKRR